ncbi:hypothetical protein [Sediminicoccus rosea]|uniref:Uncharacterized protein n=1 Tax=Sediminicoccus rosea TaxID=1225128 RepID=A0ABZ0PBT9_9PROT|nr:hypothetical protein [Sediminicoccus rosea]WPB83149.1 hypothetical protein R9Z33_13645 [Sediminicoccus rosea]
MKYVGSRFEGRRMPLDVLPDLPAFRDLLVSYIKEAWLEAHDDRERVPKGFVKSLKFDLVGIDDGSAVPVIEWDQDNAQRQLPDFKDEMEILVEAAYDKAVALIGGSADATVGERLAPVELRALNTFGSSLLPDERIEFVGRDDAQGNVVFLDAERRKRLLTRGRDSYEARFDSVGKLLGSNVDETGTDGLVIVSTAEHGTLRLSLAPDRVKDEFDGKIDADVQFRLMIELDRADRFRSVSEVLEIDLINTKVVADLQRCRDRIGVLASLSDGWHDGAGKRPTPEAVAVGLRLLARNPRLAGSYRIFPTHAGGLLFEFPQGGWDYSIEIAPGGQGEIYGVESAGDGEMETGVLDVDSEAFQRMFDQAAGGRW